MESFLATTDCYILALGGGTPCYYDNFNLYQNQEIRSFYLKASVSSLLERLKIQKNTRPIVANLKDEELLSGISTHINEGEFLKQDESGYILIGKNLLHRYSEAFGDVFASLEGVYPG